VSTGLIIILFLETAGASSLWAQGIQQPEKGPAVDRIVFDARLHEDTALKDTAEGATDILLSPVQEGTLTSLPPQVQRKLDVYEAPSATWSLMINPIPDAAPYTVTVDGSDYFNPFAIQEVRYALNFLVNRQHIVNEILDGAGGPMLTMAIPGQPGAYRYNLVPVTLGMTPTGDEAKAIEDIASALEGASHLPALEGRLVKGEKFWQWNGTDLTVKMLMNADEPNGRLKEGRYIADQIEKAGIRVERLEQDSAACAAIAYTHDPSRYEWNIYTEQWGAGENRRYWDDKVSKWFAPWRGYQVGGTNTAFWRYSNNTIDSLTQRVHAGQFTDSRQYWDMILTATELGLKEATRIPICYEEKLSVVDRARFVGRLVYGVGDGLDAWSLITADVTPARTGEKTLRVTQLGGSLFSAAWDPVGVDGFKDLGSLLISSSTGDAAAFATPTSAEDAPLRASWHDVLTKVRLGAQRNGEPVVEGGIPVPPEAIVFNPRDSRWEPVGPGASSFSKATYTYKWGTWHTGIPIGIADIMYAQAFIWKWITNLGDGDRFYDADYAAAMGPTHNAIKGILINPDTSITVYVDANAVDPDRVAAAAALYTSVSASGRPVSCSWEIIEALARMVAEGSASGTAWSFSPDAAHYEVNLLDARCVQDIRAKLQQFIDTSYVPPSIAQFTTLEECATRYKAAIAWIDTHHNAYISNGPFSIDKVDLAAKVVELKAFRDPSYPFDAGSWDSRLRVATTRIDDIAPPSAAARGKPLAVTVKVSTIDYPGTAATPTDATARVTLALVVSGSEKFFSGVFVRPGQYAITIPATETKGLAAGAYTIVAEAQLRKETPSVESSTVVLF